jgi:hypothetical protein
MRFTLIARGRQKEPDQITDLIDECLIPLILRHMGRNGRVATVQRPQFFVPIRISQKTAINDQIDAPWYAPFVGKGLE